MEGRTDRGTIFMYVFVVAHAAPHAVAGFQNGSTWRVVFNVAMLLLVAHCLVGEGRTWWRSRARRADGPA
jgi:hypothetical protein